MRNSANRWVRINTTLTTLPVSPVFHRPAGAAAAEAPGSPREDVPRDAGTFPQPGGPPENHTTHSRRTGSTATEGIYTHIHTVKSSSSLCYRTSNVGWFIVRNYQVEFHLRNGKSRKVSFLLCTRSFRMIFIVAPCQPLLIPTLPAVLIQTVFFLCIRVWKPISRCFQKSCKSSSVNSRRNSQKSSTDEKWCE